MAKNDDTVEALLAFGFIAAIGCGLYMVVKSFSGFSRREQVEGGDLHEAVEAEEIQEVVEVQNLDICTRCGKKNPKRCRTCGSHVTCLRLGYCINCEQCENCVDGLLGFREGLCAQCDD